MSKFLSVLILVFVVFSCKQEPTTGDDSGGNTELENKIKQLELNNAMKDSVINESLAFFNEIQSNLEAIGIRKDEIRAKSENQEVTADDKKWILEEIQHINHLREENASKVRQLQSQMKKNGLIVLLKKLLSVLLLIKKWYLKMIMNFG